MKVAILFVEYRKSKISNLAKIPFNVSKFILIRIATVIAAASRGISFNEPFKAALYSL